MSSTAIFLYCSGVRPEQEVSMAAPRTHMLAHALTFTPVLLFNGNTQNILYVRPSVRCWVCGHHSLHPTIENLPVQSLYALHRSSRSPSAVDSSQSCCWHCHMDIVLGLYLPHFIRTVTTPPCRYSDDLLRSFLGSTLLRGVGGQIQTLLTCVGVPVAVAYD